MCPSCHYDTPFIHLHNSVNLTIRAEILQMRFTCLQHRAQGKISSIVSQYKTQQNTNRCFIKKFSYPSSPEQGFGIQQGAYPTVRDMPFPAKTFSGEITRRNYPMK